MGLTPNPFTNTTHLNLMLNEPTILTIQVMDINGVIVMDSPPQEYKAGKNVKTLDFTNMSKGVYLIQLNCKSATQQYTLNKRMIRL